jgi:hypothetical protein
LRLTVNWRAFIIRCRNRADYIFRNGGALLALGKDKMSIVATRAKTLCNRWEFPILAYFYPSILRMGFHGTHAMCVLGGNGETGLLRIANPRALIAAASDGVAEVDWVTYGLVVVATITSDGSRLVVPYSFI